MNPDPWRACRQLCPELLTKGLRHFWCLRRVPCSHKETESEMRRADAGYPALRSAVDPENVTAARMSWRKSSWCSTNSCVEVADLPDGGVAVRDGKQPISAPVLVFSTQEWQAFISGVNAGEFG
jgi:Domain of unknown function (DUF397)